MLSVNGSIGSTGLLSSLDKAQENLTSNLLKLSTARSINSAADDAAGLAQSSSYSVQLSSQAQAMNNAQDSLSLLDTASGALGQVSGGLQQLNTLAVQAGDGALSASDRQALQQQADQITQGLDQIAGNTQFNGRNLLDGSFSQSLQSGGQSLALGSVSSSALGLSGLDLTSADGQSSAIAAIGNALQQVNAQQTTVGAAQSGLSAELSNLGTSYDNLAAANSRISDTDYAKAASDMSQASVQQQVSLKAVALYNQMQKSTLGLL